MYCNFTVLSNSSQNKIFLTPKQNAQLLSPSHLERDKFHIDYIAIKECNSTNSENHSDLLIRENPIGRAQKSADITLGESGQSRPSDP